MAGAAWAQPDVEPEIEVVPEAYRAPLPATLGNPKKTAEAPVGVVDLGRTETGLPSVVQPKAPGAEPEVPQGVRAGDALEGGAAALVMLPRLLSGETTLPKALETGALNVRDIEWILSKGLWPWGTFEGKENHTLRREMARVWIEANANKLKDAAGLSRLPQTLRLWVGDYLGSVQDERMVLVVESILRELGPKNPGQEDLTFQAVERLGWFYRDKGQLEKAAVQWLRMEALCATPGWWVPDALVEAAHLYFEDGKVGKSRELYGRVHQFNVDNITHRAFFDEAQVLMSQGEYEQARNFLKKRPREIGRPEFALSALALIGYSYYIEGRFDQAVRFANQAIALAESAPSYSGSQEMLGLARGYLQLSNDWKQSPLHCDVEEITLEDQSVQPVEKRFRVRTFRPVELVATAESQHVKVKVEATEQDGDDVMEGDASQSSLYHEQEIVLKVDPQSTTKSLDTLVTVRSPQHERAQIQVRVHVRASAQISLSTTSLFFGFVKKGEMRSRSIKLLSPKPFRISRVESDDQDLQVQPSSVDEDVTDCEVKVTWAPSQPPGQPYVHKVRVHTNVPNQEMIEVPCSAFVQR